MSRTKLNTIFVMFLILCVSVSAQFLATKTGEKNESISPPDSFKDNIMDSNFQVFGSDTECLGWACNIYTKVCNRKASSVSEDLSFISIPLHPLALYEWRPFNTTERYISKSSNATVTNATDTNLDVETLTYSQRSVHAGYHWVEIPGFSSGSVKSGLNYDSNECKIYRAQYKNRLGSTIKYDIKSGVTLDPVITSNNYFAGNTTYPFSGDVNSSLTNASVNVTHISFGLSNPDNETIEKFDVEDQLGSNLTNWSLTDTGDPTVANKSLKLCANCELEYDLGEKRQKYDFRYTHFKDGDGSGDFYQFMFRTKENQRASGAGGEGMGVKISASAVCIHRLGTGANDECYNPGLVDGNWYNIRVVFNQTGEDNIALKAWINSSSEPDAWGVNQTNIHANGSMYPSNTFIQFASQSSSGTENSDTLIDLFATGSVTAPKSYFRSKAFNTSGTISKFNLSYQFEGGSGTQVPVFNVSCDDGNNWALNVSNTTPVSCAVAGSSFIWDVHLPGPASVAYAITNVSFDFEFNEGPVLDKVRLSRAWYGNGQVNLTVNATDPDGEAIQIDVQWFVNGTNVHNSTGTIAGGSGEVNLSLNGFGSGYGNFSGGDIINLTVNATDGDNALVGTVNRTNVTLFSVGQPVITNPLNTSAFRNNPENGSINITWTAVSDANDSSTNIQYNVSYTHNENRDYQQLTTTGDTNFKFDISKKNWSNTTHIVVKALVGGNRSTRVEDVGNFTIGNASLNGTGFAVSPFSFGFGSNITMSAILLTGFGTNLTSTLNVYHLNGSLFQSMLGTANGTTNGFANISNQLVGKNFTAEFLTTNEGNTSSSNVTFSYNDFLRVKPSGTYGLVMNTSEPLRFNFSIQHNTPATLNFTISVINFTNYTVEVNQTKFAVAGGSNYTNPTLIEANITLHTNTSLDYGFFEINRSLDQRAIRVHPEIGVTDSFGRITVQFNGSRCDRENNCSFNAPLANGSVHSKSWVINNTGGDTISACRAYFQNETGETTVEGLNISLADLSVAASATTTLLVEVAANISLGTHNVTAETECAVGLIGNTTISMFPEQVPYVWLNISNSEAGSGGGNGGGNGDGGGGGGGGGTTTAAVGAGVSVPSGPVCGDNFCAEPTETLFSCAEDCFTFERVFVTGGTDVALAGGLAILIGAGILLFSQREEDRKKKKKKKKKKVKKVVRETR